MTSVEIGWTAMMMMWNAHGKWELKVRYIIFKNTSDFISDAVG